MTALRALHHSSRRGADGPRLRKATEPAGEAGPVCVATNIGILAAQCVHARQNRPEHRGERCRGRCYAIEDEAQCKKLGFNKRRRPERDPSTPRVGVHVLKPGEANGYYHAEAAQEGFLVLSGECIAVVEGQERRMRRWDYLHSPPGTAHITVGAGEEPCAIVMFGSPDPARKVEWIAHEVAAKHGASVAETTGRDTEAYGDLPPAIQTRSPEPFRASM